MGLRTGWIAAVVLMSCGAAMMAQEKTDLGAIRGYYEAGVKANGIVGSSLLLMEGGKVVMLDGVGKQQLGPDVAVDERTTYHWASVTKTLTGIAVMQLRDRGLLGLDDPLVKYIPELAAVHDGYGSIGQVTIRQAMSHSAGFRNATWPWDTDAPSGEATPWAPFEPTEWSQIVAMLPFTEILFAPGSRFQYSNLGVVFLGEIIQRVSGDAFEVYMMKNVLRPLGMEHSYYDRAPWTLLEYRSHSWERKDGKLAEQRFDFNTGITRSNGGLNAPMGDMARYLEFLIGDPGREAEFAQVLKRASLMEMLQPLLPVVPDDDFQSRAGASDQVAHSFFVHTDKGLKLYGHAGWQNGFRSHLYFDPVSRKGYLVAYNTNALDAKENTNNWDFVLRDYLIDHFFEQR